ncbi:MAG: beta strand repeat-containing protein [Chitinophagaceae bacterium]
MKKSIFTCINLLIVVVGLAQTTYYWSGGGVATSWATASNWNTILGGTGLSRSTPNISDTLIFDGSNLGNGFTGQITVTSVPYQTIGALIFRNGADVRFTSSPGTPISGGTTSAGVQIGTSNNFTGQTIAGSGTSFTSFFSVGDFVNTATSNSGTGGTNSIGQITAIASDISLTQSNGTLVMTATNGTSSFFMKSAMLKIDKLLQVDANSKFDLASSAPLIFKLTTGSVGTINGIVAASTNFQKLVAEADGTTFITFNNGSRFQFTGTQSTAPFDAVANATNNNIIFKAGATYEHNSTTSATTNSAGNVFGAVIPKSVVDFQKGSTFVHNSNIISSIVSNANRAYPNVILSNSTSAWQPLTQVDTLTVSPNTTWTNSSNSYFPIKGDFIMQGTFASGTASPVFIFCGNVPQNITVTGSVASSGFARIVIGSSSTVKISNSFTQNVATSLSTNGSFIRNFGRLDFGNSVVTNLIENQNGALQGYASSTTVGTQTGAIVNAATPYQITVASVTGFSQGMNLSGTGIPANTTILLVSGTTITVSNSIPAGTYDIASSVRTNGSEFISAHTNGLAANYSLQTGSTYSLPSAPGANFTFNAATITPFPSSITSLQVNNLTIGANVSSNILSLNVNGTLNLTNNKLTIPVLDTVRIVSGNAIMGSSATGYVALDASPTTGDKGLMRISNISNTTTFPIGTATHYLPVTITPSSANEDYTIAVFNAVTTNATPNGTAVTVAQKADIVDAVWLITNNFSPTGNTTLSFAWPNALEGANFATLGNTQIGVSQYIQNTGWSTFSGSGNNTSNNATNTYNSFSAFVVGKIGETLPVKFGNIHIAVENEKNVKIKWQVFSEVAIEKYIIESSNNGTLFTEKGFVNATQLNEYSFVDINVMNALKYFRIKAI